MNYKSLIILHWALNRYKNDESIIKSFTNDEIKETYNTLTRVCAEVVGHPYTSINNEN